MAKMNKETAIEKIKTLIAKGSKLNEGFMKVNYAEREIMFKKADVYFEKADKLAKKFSIDTMKVMDEMNYPRYDESGARI